jgi:hypothetical protein
MTPGFVDLVVTPPPYFGVTDYVKSQRLTFEWFGYEIEPYRKQEIGARSKRHRKTAAVEYHAELGRTLTQLARIMKPRAHLVMVLGEPEARPGVLADLIVQFGNWGFAIERDFERTISHRRRQHPSLHNERLLILKNG